MDVEKLFNDLESNNLQEYEDTKKKLTEVFSQTKEQWLVQGMLDYYLTTNSSRIIEILVKVQPPHDMYIFDRLSDWLRGQNRVSSLYVFGFIVRKHPTWLYKVAKHKLMKDILRLLQTEKEIIPLMSALLSIITLLPIIPSLIPNFLSDLFDVFGHLASWNCQNPIKLTKNQLIHLQIGLYMLFHRLYGMFPCHFISYLREFKDREKGAIFHHTIKPLLETVRMHPMLITASKETEVNSIRWKEMEPHDVVVECAKLSLNYYQDNCEHFSNVSLRPHESLPCNTEISMSKLQRSLRDTRFQSTAPAFYTLLQRELFDAHQNSDNIWSPSIDVLATPPPTGTVPHTPTPSYGVPLNTNVGSVGGVITSGNNLLGGTGASPPEAAVEATPETTPMKDINLKRIIASNSPVIRAILPSLSQPSSPMRKEQSPFHFPESSSGHIFASGYNIEQTTTTTTKITPLHRRLENQMMGGNNAVASKQLVGQLSLPSEISNQMPSDGINLAQQQPQAFMKFGSSFVTSLDSPTNFTESGAQDDQETTTGLTTTSQQQIGDSGPRHSDTLQDISYECGDDGENDECEQSPCSVGGLHAPSNRSMQILAQRIKRNHLASYCYNDTSSYLSYGTSPADVTNTDANLDISLLKSAKVRRVKSWHAIERRCSLNDEDNCCCCTNNHPRYQQLQLQYQESFQQQNGDSSSPSGDDAISAATHFKKVQQKKEKKLLSNQQKQQQQQQQPNSNQELHLSRNCHHRSYCRHNYHYNHHHYHNHQHHHHHNNQNRNHIQQQLQQNTVETQTIQQWPQIYEYNLSELLSEDRNLRLKLNSSTSVTETKTSGTSATTNTAILHQPSSDALLEQYIERTIKMKQSIDARNRDESLKDQIHLLQIQLQFERYRREIHAERNRRLLGKNRELRSLQMDNDRLKDQLNKLQSDLHILTTQISESRRLNTEREYDMQQQINTWKSKYHTELDDNKKLRSTIEQLQRRLNEEIKQRREINYEIEALHGEIFDLRNDMQQAQYQAELGTRYKLELTKLESEFLVMGENQIKCRDKLIELDNQKAKENEISHIQETYSEEIKELRNTLEIKSAQLEATKHKLNEVQSQLSNKEVIFTDQKRFLKSVKDEYEEKFKALNNKYEVQKAIILSMEQTIFELFKSQSAVNLTFSPESDKTDIVGSVDHISPLSLSLASSEGLSASLRSVPELRNLQALVQPNTASSANTTITATVTTASMSISSYSQSKSQLQQQQQIVSQLGIGSTQKEQLQQQQFLRRSSANTHQHSSSSSSTNSFFPINQQQIPSSMNMSSPSSSSTATTSLLSRSTRTLSVPNTSQIITTIASTSSSLIGGMSSSSSSTLPGGTRHSASSVDIPVPGPSQHHSNLRHHR